LIHEWQMNFSYAPRVLVEAGKSQTNTPNKWL
jgi:hypothetical protein